MLRDAYKGVDVETELKRMAIWLCSPRGKLRAGSINFIMNWLGRYTPTTNSPAVKEPEKPSIETPLRPHLNEYLKGLWKDREHLLTLNQKTN